MLVKTQNFHQQFQKGQVQHEFITAAGLKEPRSEKAIDPSCQLTGGAVSWMDPQLPGTFIFNRQPIDLCVSNSEEPTANQSSGTFLLQSDGTHDHRMNWTSILPMKVINLPMSAGKHHLTDGPVRPGSAVDESRGVRGQVDLFLVFHRSPPAAH